MNPIRNRRALVKSRGEARMMAEQLERRQLLATIAVTTLSDSGPGTVGPPVPELTVFGSFFPIANGDSTPSSADHTDFGTHPRNTVVSRRFAVLNVGDAPLLLSGLTVPSYCSIDPNDGLNEMLPPGWSDTFTVIFQRDIVGTVVGEISFTTNDPDDATFNFAISATMQALPPEISVSSNDTDFGTAAQSAVHTMTIPVRNLGESELVISDVDLPSGFSLSGTDPLNTTIAGNSSDTFTVVVDTSTRGDYSGTITIASNDPNQPNYSFNVTGTVGRLAPELTVFGNGNPIANGDTTPSSADHTDFGTHPRTTVVSRTFTVRNTGMTPLLTSGLNVPWYCWIDPNDGLSGTIAAGSSDTFTVFFQRNTVGTVVGEISFTSNDPDNATFNFAFSANLQVLPPEISVHNNDTDFGTAELSAVHTMTIPVRNLGDADLVISDVDLPPGLSLSGTDPLNTTIAGNSSDTFTVVVDTSTRGNYFGTITIASNDPNRPNYSFDVTGTVGRPVPELTVTGNGNLIANGDTTPSLEDYTQLPDSLILYPGSNFFEIRNNGTGPLQISNVTLPTGFAFSQGLELPTSLAAGRLDVFGISCNAKTPGTYTGTVTFNTNDPANPVFSFKIAATVGWTILAQGNLGIATDDTADNIQFTTVGTDLILTINDSTEVFEASAVTMVYIDSGGGDDRITLPEQIAMKAYVFGGNGRDRISGGPGSETLIGGAGGDFLNGNDGDDNLRGAGGNDKLYGGEGADFIRGDDGNDALDGGMRADTLRGGEGDDLLIGGRNNDKLYGDRDNDTLDGNQGRDILYGGPGNDSGTLDPLDWTTGGIEVLT
jgi:Ca2+-binding RTX toxin-like protein